MRIGMTCDEAEKVFGGSWADEGYFRRDLKGHLGLEAATMACRIMGYDVKVSDLNYAIARDIVQPSRNGRLLMWSHDDLDKVALHFEREQRYDELAHGLKFWGVSMFTFYSQLKKWQESLRPKLAAELPANIDGLAKCVSVKFFRPALARP